MPNVSLDQIDEELRKRKQQKVSLSQIDEELAKRQQPSQQASLAEIDIELATRGIAPGETPEKPKQGFALPEILNPQGFALPEVLKPEFDPRSPSFGLSPFGFEEKTRGAQLLLQGLQAATEFGGGLVKKARGEKAAPPTLVQEIVPSLRTEQRPTTIGEEAFKALRHGLVAGPGFDINVTAEKIKKDPTIVDTIGGIILEGALGTGATRGVIRAERSIRGLKAPGKRILEKVRAGLKSQQAFEEAIQAEKVTKAQRSKPLLQKPPTETIDLSPAQAKQRFQMAKQVEAKLQKALAPDKVEQKLKNLQDIRNQIQNKTGEAIQRGLLPPKAINRIKNVTLHKLDRQITRLVARKELVQQKRVTRIREVQSRFNDLRMTSSDVARGFRNIKKTSLEPIVLPETTVETRSIAGITPRGNIITREMVEALEATKDLSRTSEALEVTPTIIDKLDEGNKVGLFKRILRDPIIDATINETTEKSFYIDGIVDIAKKHKLTSSDSVALRRFIEKKAPALPGKEKAYQEIADKARTLYDDLLLKWNRARTAQGLPPVVRRDDYVTHLRELAVLDDLHAGQLDPVSMDILSGKRAVPQVGFEQPRLDAIPEDELAGFFESFSAYTHKTSRFIHQADLTDKIRVFARITQKQGKPVLSEWFNRLADDLVGDASFKQKIAIKEATGGLAVDKLMKAYDRSMSNFIKNVVLTNPGAWMGNIGASIPASPKIGTSRALRGSVQGVISEMGESIIKAVVNPHYSSFPSKVSKTFKISTMSELNPFLNVGVDNFITRTGKNMFALFNEGVIKGIFNQAYKSAIKSGASVKEAALVADEITARANAIYINAMRPRFLAARGGKLLSPISTYIFNSISQLGTDLRGLSMMQKSAVIARYGATGMALNLMTNAVIGRPIADVGDFVPFMRLFQYGLGAGPFAVAKGLAKGTGALTKGKPGKAVLELGSGLILVSPFNFGGLVTVRGARQLSQGEFDIRRMLFGGPRKKKGDSIGSIGDIGEIQGF